MSPISAESLCQYCKGLNVETISEPGGHAHAHSLAVIQDNAKQGCTLCDWFITLTWRRDIDDELREVEPPTSAGRQCSDRFHVRPVGPGYLGQSHICLTDETGEYQTTGLEVCRLESDPAPDSCLIPICKALSNTASPETQETALSWLTQCEVEHDCNSFSIPAPNNTYVLPGRLVDLRSFTPTSPIVRLVETSRLSESITNAPGFCSTLSYCWGITPFYNTISANLASSLTQIPFDTLPQTFKDAFLITTRLGTLFIWIDALCIIQDSLHDWETESVKMPYIYSLSRFCIAADATAIAGGGCFNGHSHSPQHPRRKEATPLVIPSVLTSTSQTSRLFIYPRHHHSTNSQSPIADAPISTRGWCFQERFLSPRTLHYTSEQLFWECRQDFKSEDLISNTQGQPWGTMPGALAQLYDPTFRPEHVVRTWYKSIVAPYSRRRLTKETDRLPAIGGVARVYAHLLSQAEQRIRNAETQTWVEGWVERQDGFKQYDVVENGVYIAGVWGHQIGHGLSWRRKRGAEMPAVEPGRRRTNTFSWVSVDGPVEHLYGYIEATRLVKWHVPLLNPLDPFGGVGECEITLEGNVIEGKLGYYQDDNKRGEWRVFVDIPPDGELDYGAVDIGGVDIDKD
ncbi:putative heterokaryon incompatibility protein [Cercophora samala]|uniref:Heterokaryon incompatibility protein n=1 Tax=Cercophora samala TaxID=330535 RepID=A0AA40D2D5_9PEZI|nr:putative heterokaryon incompatibility protein [Cercophora samala]